MKQNKIFSFVITALFIIFAIILIVQIVLKLTGHSPTDTQIIYMALGAIISYLLVMSYNMGTFVGEMKEFTKVTKKSFVKLKEDVSELKREIKK